MSYLILSTYPEKGTRNSGDELLGVSLAKLIKAKKGNDTKIDFISVVDKKPEDMGDFQQYHAILAPGLRPTIKGSSIAPENRNLFLEEALKKSIPVFGVGAGWKTYPGTINQSNRLMLDANDKQMLLDHFGSEDNANKLGGAISCRDITTENLLVNNGIKCYGTTGDCGLFDIDHVDTPMITPNKIEKISVSMPHNKHHKEMAYKMALQLKNEFACEVSITFHGYKGKLSDQIPQHWDTKMIEIVDLSGGSDNLKYYNEVDAHVGFRLHAHIWFLRTRKPSLLIGEDGRGMGHLYTVDGLGYSAASTLSHKISNLHVDNSNKLLRLLSRREPKFDAISMFKQEVNNNFEVTKNTLKKVDYLWHSRMSPFLDLIP